MIKLYMIPACPFVHRVLLACEVRKIGQDQIRKVEIQLDKPPMEMLKINPTGSVPTLEFESGDGFHESLVIMEFLDTLPALGPKIYGDTPKQTAMIKVLWESASNKLLTPLQQAIYSFGNVNNLRAANESLKSAWQWTDAQLNRLGGAYFGGKEMNAIDIAIAPFLMRLKYVAEAHPTIELPPMHSTSARYLSRVSERCGQTNVFPDESVMRETTLKFAIPHSLFKAVQEAPRLLIENPEPVIKALGDELSAWTLERDQHGYCLRAHFTFPTHSDAVTKIKWLHDAQEICDHHTSFVLRDFTNLEITLVTHEPRWGVTQKDVTMAKLLQTYFIKGQLPT